MLMKTKQLSRLDCTLDIRFLFVSLGSQHSQDLIGEVRGLSVGQSRFGPRTSRFPVCFEARLRVCCHSYANTRIARLLSRRRGACVRRDAARVGAEFEHW